MAQSLLFIIAGYFSGSVLYARLFGMLFKHEDIIEKSRDHNPGTANAFMQGGFWCGMFTLVFDLLKGFIPVYAYMWVSHIGHFKDLGAALVLAAPVFGHIFPIFGHFKGGKGIATTFGCLLGLFPDLGAALILAFFFLFFSLILRVTPHYDRTIWTYTATLVTMRIVMVDFWVVIGFALITGGVFIRLYTSKEEREKRRVRLLWMH